MTRVLQWKIVFIICFLCFSAIGQQPYLNFDDELDASVLIVKYSNNAACEGQLEISVSGGVAPYKYSIDAGTTFMDNHIISDLCSQKYFIHVRDAEGKLGLAYVNLVPPNPEVDPFTLEEKEAIRVRLVEDLNVEKSNYQVGSISSRKVDWKLWKLRESIETELVLTEETDDFNLFEIAVLVPPSISSSQYESELSRIKESFSDVNIELTMDYGTWILTVKIDKLESNDRLTNLVNHLGFSVYSISDQTSN